MPDAPPVCAVIDTNVLVSSLLTGRADSPTVKVRKIIVKSFYVFYRIDEPAGTVFVLNVIYARRDQ